MDRAQRLRRGSESERQVKPFRRRRIPRRTYTPQIGFTEEPPLLLRRKRAGLPRYEDRTLVLIVVRENGQIEQHVIFEPNEERKQKASKE